MRQKRRNLLLGTGIAFGMCLLMIATSLGTGISDLLLNKMVASFSGHIFVTMSEKDDTQWDIIRDKDRIKNIILENVDGVHTIRENITAHGKALGNRKSLYATVVGIDPKGEMFRGTPLIAGSLEDMTNPGIENPLALYERMAEKLNVQVNDVIQMRCETVYGQVQTARFTVVAVMEAVNPFLNMLMYCPLDQLKPLVGYQIHESKSFQIVLDRVTDPQRLIEQANRLHNALKPGAAGYMGIVHAHGIDENVAVVAIAPGEDAQRLFSSHIHIVAGSLEKTFNDAQAVILSQRTAEALQVSIGDKVTSRYKTQFDEIAPSHSYRIGAIFEADEVLTPEMMFVHAEQLYETVFPVLPLSPVQISRDSALFPVLVKEWHLLERTTNQVASEKKYQTLRLNGWRGAILDVRTIHEVAGEVLEFEKALKLVTVVGIVTLFFIIQIGVVNTLRMTIRERTREIGTVRAIGMQRGDVRQSFVIEVVLLTLFACLCGIGAGLLLIQVFSAMSIDTGGSEMGFFLLNNHLHFVTRIGVLLKNLVIILGIAFLTAYFPARTAAKLSVAEALRHYE